MSDTCYVIRGLAYTRMFRSCSYLVSPIHTHGGRAQRYILADAFSLPWSWLLLAYQETRTTIPNLHDMA